MADKEKEPQRTSYSLGFTPGGGGSKTTQRQGSEVQFPRQFVLDYHNTFGGPFTVNDLFTLAPRSHALFGGGDTGPLRPGGGFNLGFGAPGGGPLPTSTYAPTPGPAGPSAPAPAPTDPNRRYAISDILDAWSDDPEKKMDIGRLFKGSMVDPNNFTLEQFQNLIGKAKKKGFSGRSRGNFDNALAILQQKGQLSETFVGGGKGTGIF